MENKVTVRILNKKISNIDDIVLVIDNDKCNIDLSHKTQKNLVTLMYYIINIVAKEIDLSELDSLDVLYLDVLFDENFNIKLDLSDGFVFLTNKELYFKILNILKKFKI